MNVNYEKLDNVTGKLTVTLEEKDYADNVKKQLKELGRRHAEPGFRPGHVPAALIAKKYGTSVKYDVINKQVADAVFNYIKENNLHVLGQPVPTSDSEFDINNADFTFLFELGLAPEIDTHVNKDMHVPYYTIKVSDKMIDEQVAALRERFGRQVAGEEVEPKALVKGVITELDENGNDKVEGVVVENGILGPDHFVDADQKKLFEGKKVGESVVFNPAVASANNEVELSSMLNVDKADVENHKGDFRFDIKEIIVLRPAEMDQEFFDNAVGKDKAHNEEELRAAVKELIAASLANDSEYKFTIDAKKAVEDAVGEVELPVKILKNFLVNQGNGITPENVDEEFDKMKGQLVWDLIKDEIATKYEVKVTEDDMQNEAKGLVARQLMQYGAGMLNDEIINHYVGQLLSDDKNKESIFQNALARKVFEAIKANVTLDNKEVTTEEFQALIG